jgi:hypothetical protein
MADRSATYETFVELDDEELTIRIEFDYDPGRPARLSTWPGEPAEGPEVTDYDILLWDEESARWSDQDAAWQERVVEALGGDYRLCERLLDSLGGDGWGV